MAKALVLLVGAVLLAQYCNCRSIGTAETELVVNDSDSLLYYGVVQFTVLLVKTINNGKEWLEDAHKEIGTIAIKNEKTLELDQQIVEFLTKVRQLDEIQDEEKKFEKMSAIFEEVLDISSKYDDSNTSNSPEQQSLAELMKRTGMDNFDTHFVVDFLRCTEDVVTKTEQYLNSLSSSEKRKERKLVSWLSDFKNEADVEKKFEIFSNFFDLFDD